MDGGMRGRKKTELFFPWRPQKLDQSDGDSIIKSKFDIKIIRTEWERVFVLCRAA